MLGHLVVDFLTFLKGPQPSALYIGVVDEDVPTPMVGGDEAVAFFRVEPANRSLGHMQEPASLYPGLHRNKKATPLMQAALPSKQNPDCSVP